LDIVGLQPSWAEYTRFFVALLAVLDPLAAIPIFLSLTEHYSSTERARTAWVTSAAVGGLLIVCALAGESALTLMGTSVAALRVGGGIVLLLMALSMLTAQPGRLRQTPEEAEEAVSKEAVAVVPLGIPLLAGPGAMSTVIIEMDRGSGLLHGGLVVGTILVVSFLCWAVLRNAAWFGKALGPIGMNIGIRLFGLILAAIAVEFIVNGLKQLLPVLGDSL
jgi:multiple antibiotic resistance protein